MSHEMPWLLNRSDGWVMPAGTSFGSEAARTYADAHQLSPPFSSATVDAYLRSIGAVPFDEYVAEKEKAQAALAELRKRFWFAQVFWRIFAGACDWPGETILPENLPTDELRGDMEMVEQALDMDNAPELTDALIHEVLDAWKRENP